MKVHSPRLHRLVGLCLLIFLLLSVGVFGANLVVSHITTGKTTTPITPPASATSENLLSNHDSWPNSDTYFYVNQQYHIKNVSKCCVALAPYANHQFSDFRLTVTMREIEGPHDTADYYGVIFRASVNPSHYYVFEIGTADGGQYGFWRYDGSQWRTIKTGPAPSLLISPAASNTITVEVHRNTFTFLINEKPIDKPVSDTFQPALTAGEIGLYVEGEAEVAFSNLYVDGL
jgi:hypothetical protein